MNDMDIDWAYLLDRFERLLDLGEEALSRQLQERRLDPRVFARAIAFRWQPEHPSGPLLAVEHPDLPDHADLVGVGRALQRLRRNTLQFLRGYPANNVLLWGERGSGKSTAVKGLLREFGDQGLRLIEVRKDDLGQLPVIIALLRGRPERYLLFCDDLAFGEEEGSYRELKALLEGGIEARPENVLVYATSNRRHLMPERMSENTGEAEIHPEESVAEKLSLSDRFGITLGFYPMNQQAYLQVVQHWAGRHGVELPGEELERQALLWALGRGARSGRVARQFVDDLAGRLALVAEGLLEED
jgi:uncharacterized protein